MVLCCISLNRLWQGGISGGKGDQLLLQFPQLLDIVFQTTPSRIKGLDLLQKVP